MMKVVYLKALRCPASSGSDPADGPQSGEAALAITAQSAEARHRF